LKFKGGATTVVPLDFVLRSPGFAAGSIKKRSVTQAKSVKIPLSNLPMILKSFAQTRALCSMRFVRQWLDPCSSMADIAAAAFGGVLVST